jgi:hypothetical protein
MSTPIIFADVELWCTGYLRTELAAHGYPGMSVVNARTTTTPQVWVRRDGGPTLDRLRESARLGVNVYAPSEQAVTDLARTVSALLRAAASPTVLQVTQTLGPSPIADNTPRRYMTFDVICKGALL